MQRNPLAEYLPLLEINKDNVCVCHWVWNADHVADRAAC